jgi:hypothetical protein
LLAAGLAAVSGPLAPSSAGLPQGTWVGTVTREGNITTVVNESGSLWGGAATLVEEASIGVDTGAEAYMLGRIGAVAASTDRIYVADLSVPVVRMYTFDGDHVGDIGRDGQGPGEYTYPTGIAIAADGRVIVRSRARVIEYTAEGDHIVTYSMPSGGDVPFIVAADGTPYGGVVVDPEATYFRLSYGVVAYGPEGPSGAPLVPPRFDVEPPHVSGSGSLPVRHAEEYVWTMDAWGNLIAGASGTYSFEIARPDGATVIVRRLYDAVAVSDDERTAAERSVYDFYSRRGDRGGFRWTGPPIPRTKPAFVKFMPTWSGELWLLRAGPAELDESARWRDSFIVDAFAGDGRFLGEVQVPHGVEYWMGAFATDHGGPFAFVRDDLVLMPIEDEAGIIKVKRYRLEPPGN